MKTVATAVVILWCAVFPVQGQTATSTALMASLDDLRQDHGISALALVVVDGGSGNTRFNFFAGLGTLSHSSEEPITPKTVFRLGSITKSFTALTLLRQAEQGDISLTDRLDAHVDPTLWRNDWRTQSPITLEQLLEHSAGFSGLSKDEWDVAEALPLEANLRRYADRHVVAWEPGLWSSYSNLGAGFVGQAMEKVAGQSWETLVKQQVLAPLRMRSSGFEPGAVKVVGYDRDGKTVIPYWHMVYRPFGALNSTPEDMARYLRLHLGKGTLDEEVFLPAVTMSRVERAQTTLAARHGLDLGYGLGNYSWLRDGFLFHGHGGDADGYLARFAYSHELGRGYFLVINAFNNPALLEMRRQVERYLVDGQSAVEAVVGPALTQEQHGWLAGRYRPQTTRFGGPVSGRNDIAVQLRDGQLSYRGSRGQIRLFPVAESPGVLKVRYRDDNRATAVFIQQPDGSVVFTDDRMNLLRAAGDKPPR